MSIENCFIRQMSTLLFKNSFMRGFWKTSPKGFLRFQGSSPSCRLYGPEAGLVISTHLPDEAENSMGKSFPCSSTFLTQSDHFL
jgi:hypothetical protein